MKSLLEGFEQLYLMNAAGMVKTVEDMAPLLTAPITHIVIGGVTVEPRAGNPEPTFWVADDGSYALNSRGLPNRGAAYYRKNLGRMVVFAHAYGKELVLNINSTTCFDDWMQLAAIAATHPQVKVILNSGCPNKWHSGVNEPTLGNDPDALAAALDAVYAAAPNNELWLKLPPYLGPKTNQTLVRVCDVIRARPFIKMLVSCNTLGGQVPPIGPDGKPVISMPTAGMSGRALKPLSLAQHEVLAKLLPNVPRIGVGGIYTGA